MRIHQSRRRRAPRVLGATLAAFGLVGAVLAAAPSAYAALPPGPTITSFSPTTGGVGTPVTIDGSGFTGATKVTFNGSSSTFTIDSDTEISTTVPAAASSGKIAVTVPGEAPGKSSTAFTVVVGVTWSQFGYNAARSGYNPNETILSSANVSGLTQAWGVGGALDAGGGEPTVADGAVYASEGDSNEILASSAATGAQLWTFQSPCRAQFSDPVVSKGTVFVGDFGCTGPNSDLVYALNASTGKVKWSWDDQGQYPADLAVVSGTVYVVSKDSPVTGGNFSILYALNAAKGTEEWSYEPYTSVCSGGSSCSSDEFSAPAVSNGVVYFDADLFASSEIDSVFALSASTGAVQWTTSAVTLVGRTFTPAVTGNAVYVAGKNTLYALHTSDGSLKWSSSPAPIEITTDPATANGSVFVGGYSGVLYDLRATNGLLKWSTNPSSGSPLSDARIANGIVYVGSSGVDTDAGAVSALNESSGSLLWSFNGGVEDFSSIAILNGMLYVSANDAGSALTAFGVPAASSRTR